MILHTEMVGNGEPIVFLHTGLQTGITDFEYQRDEFKDSFQVIQPDLRGHGQSVTNNFTNYFEQSAKDLADTFDHFNISSAHIVGCSIGAIAGIYFAKRFPEHIKSLTISGVIPEQPVNWSDLHNLEREQHDSLLKNDEAVQYFDQLHQSNWKQFFEIVKDENWYPFEETKNIKEINQPILYIVGEGNERETRGAWLYPKQKEDVHISIIPFASHLVHIEQPELYSKTLRTFINHMSH